MSDVKFTPGPWIRTIFANGQNRIVTKDRTYRDSDIAHTYGKDDTDNANLIAAAPDLYEALQSVLAITADSDGVSGYHLNGDIAEWGEFDEIATAIAALAKARGEQP